MHWRRREGGSLNLGYYTPLSFDTLVTRMAQVAEVAQVTEVAEVTKELEMAERVIGENLVTA